MTTNHSVPQSSSTDRILHDYHLHLLFCHCIDSNNIFHTILCTELQYYGRVACLDKVNSHSDIEDCLSFNLRGEQKPIYIVQRTHDNTSI